MTFKQSLGVIMIGAITFAGGAFAFSQVHKQSFADTTKNPNSSIFKTAKYTDNPSTAPNFDFEKAAAKAAPVVVHIRTVTKAKQMAGMGEGEDNPFKEFFGPGFPGLGDGHGMSPMQRGSGSGVILSADGYIVTNNHVVDGADELSVTLNNKTDYKAKVIGRDPSSDLAVIKIDAKNLPFVTFANSDNVHLGQWVLAIGYPLNLGTTVTSGIVSAKARNIGINNRNSNAPIESFIQTDAAVNPGNSGGALVNIEGDLIGINSAIASPTGSYAGYSYAIPANLVQKVASDIIKYGSNKRAYLGVMFPNDELTQDDRAKNDIKEGNGVYVLDVAKGSAADEAGIQKGDFITSINGTEVTTGTEMVERISGFRPGDRINIGFTHNGSDKKVNAVLKGSTGTYASIKNQMIEQLGASFGNLEKEKAAQLNIESGVVVTDPGQGLLAEQTRIRKGFIITNINDTRVGSIDELKEALKNAGNSAVITGVYPEHPGQVYKYALNNLNGGE